VRSTETAATPEAAGAKKITTSIAGRTEAGSVFVPEQVPRQCSTASVTAHLPSGPITLRVDVLRVITDMDRCPGSKAWLRGV
jgi:hypothetical protein